MSTFIIFVVYLTLGIFGLSLVIFLLFQLYNLCKALSIKSLEYRRYFSEEGVFEGESLLLIEELSNRSFIPMFHIDVQSNINSNIKLEGCVSDDSITQQFVSRFTVMPFMTIRRSHKAVCRKRGYYELETANVVFARMELFLESKAPLYVYPKMVKIDEAESINLYMQYTSYSNRPLIADPFSFAGVREYQHTDSFNSINFKATARRGELMVNNRDYLLGRKLMVYINFQPGEKYIPSALFEHLMEQALSYSAYIFGEAATKGYQVGYAANCRMVNGDNYVRFPMSSGQSHYRELLKRLSLIRPIYGNSFASILDMEINDSLSETEIYILTPYMDSTIGDRIDIFRNMGNTVNVTLLEGDPELWKTS